MAARRIRRRPATLPVIVLPSPTPGEMAEVPAVAALRLTRRYGLPLSTASAIVEANAWGCR